MAKEVPYEKQLVPCPRGCGTHVQREKAGNPHPVVDIGLNVYITCK